MNRDKLIEAIRLSIARVLDFKVNEKELELLADHLIANGIGDITALTKENAHLTEQLKNAVVLPCKVGDTVYAIAKCSDVTRKLDGTYYSSDGSPGTATGWYCAFDGKEDNCPLCGEDNCNEKDYAIFETEVLGMSYSESDEDKGWHIYLENLDTYESYHSTKPEAEARLKEQEDMNG